VIQTMLRMPGQSSLLFVADLDAASVGPGATRGALRDGFRQFYAASGYRVSKRAAAALISNQ
jgi:hypothetical protein